MGRAHSHLARRCSKVGTASSFLSALCPLNQIERRQRLHSLYACRRVNRKTEGLRSILGGLSWRKFDCRLRVKRNVGSPRGANQRGRTEGASLFRFGLVSIRDPCRPTFESRPAGVTSRSLALSGHGTPVVVSSHAIAGGPSSSPTLVYAHHGAELGALLRVHGWGDGYARPSAILLVTVTFHLQALGANTCCHALTPRRDLPSCRLEEPTS
jgi:hypothetical protein